MSRLGKLSRPADAASHELYKFPLSYSDDAEMMTLDNGSHWSSDVAKKLNTRQSHAVSWHTDTIFENVPADYSSLTLVEFPEAGGGG